MFYLFCKSKGLGGGTSKLLGANSKADAALEAKDGDEGEGEPGGHGADDGADIGLTGGLGGSGGSGLEAGVKANAKI